jgi:hypothetical protein
MGRLHNVHRTGGGQSGAVRRVRSDTTQGSKGQSSNEWLHKRNTPCSVWEQLLDHGLTRAFASGMLVRSDVISTASRSSDAQIFAHHFVRQFADRTGSDTASFVENAKLARHAPCERQLLLHQQDGKPFILV